MLTEKQQKVFKKLLHSVERKENYFLSSEDRGIGKTFTLNELAFTLQALGYKVYVLTPYPKQVYYANGIISLDLIDLSGVDDNTVIIVDGVKFKKMKQLLEYCKLKRFPVVGYVEFS